MPARSSLKFQEDVGGVGTCHEMIKRSSICRTKHTLKNLRASDCEEGQIRAEGSPYSDPLRQTAMSQYMLKEMATSASRVKIPKILQNIVYVYYAYSQNTCTAGRLCRVSTHPLFGTPSPARPVPALTGPQPLPGTSAHPQGPWPRRPEQPTDDRCPPRPNRSKTGIGILEASWYVARKATNSLKSFTII